MFFVCRFVSIQNAIRPNGTLEKETYYRYFQQLVEDFGESMPDSWATYPKDKWKRVSDATKETRPLIFLHNGLFSTKKAVFKDFLDRGIVTKKVGVTTMREWWLNDFWNVRVKKWMNFAKCDQCIKARTDLIIEKNDSKLQEIRVERAKHRGNISLGRRRYSLRELMSIKHPNDFLSATIDGMDNKKTHTPQQRGLTSTKSSSGAGEPLKTRLMGRWL